MQPQEVMGGDLSKIQGHLDNFHLAEEGKNLIATQAERISAIKTVLAQYPHQTKVDIDALETEAQNVKAAKEKTEALKVVVEKSDPSLEELTSSYQAAKEFVDKLDSSKYGDFLDFDTLEKQYDTKIEEMKQVLITKVKDVKERFTLTFNESSLDDILLAQEEIMGRLDILFEHLGKFEDAPVAGDIVGEYIETKNQLTAIRTGLKDLPNTIDLTTTDLDAVEDQIATLEDSIKRLTLPRGTKLDITAEKQKIEDVKQKIEEAKKQIEQKISTADQATTVYELAFSNKDNDLAALKNKFDQLQPQIEVLQTIPSAKKTEAIRNFETAQEQLQTLTKVSEFLADLKKAENNPQDLVNKWED